MNEIKILQADYGDSIIIRYLGIDNNFHNILIDGGLVRTYSKTQKLKNEILSIVDRNEKIDLLIVTHIDQDHIGGIKSFFSDKKIDKPEITKIWFNSGRLISKFFESNFDASRDTPLSDSSGDAEISYSQGIFLEEKIKESKIETQIIHSLQKFELFGASITILSPSIKSLKNLNKCWQIEYEDSSFDMSSSLGDYTVPIEDLKIRKFKEDKSIPNDSSIAFLFELGNKRILFLGDALSSSVIDALKKLGYTEKNKLKVDFWKISHHGSKKSTSPELISLIDCNQFIISTSGAKYKHPSKETLARLVSSEEKSTFYFNYDNFHLRNIFAVNEIQKYNIKCKFSKHSIGQKINF